MMDAMQNNGMQYPIKRISIEPDIVLRKNLENVVSDNTHRIFTLLGI